jgi:hypothetical protein
MKTDVMQFDGDGGYDAPLNSGKTASAGMEDSDARKVATSVNTNTAEGVAAASATPPTGPSPLAMTSGMSGGPKPKAPKTIDKSAWDKGTKVSQAMVDRVKDEGRGNMGAKPQAKVKNGAPGYDGSMFSPNAPVSAEYKEAVKRVYPNGAPASKPSSKAADKPSPSFNESSPNAKAFPKVAAPKSRKEDVTAARNKEISEANNKGTALNDRIAYNIINAGKEGLSAFGIGGTPKFSQIPGTQTKTQKAQAAAKAERAASVAAAKKKK